MGESNSCSHFILRSDFGLRRLVMLREGESRGKELTANPVPSTIEQQATKQIMSIERSHVVIGLSFAQCRPFDPKPAGAHEGTPTSALPAQSYAVIMDAT